MPLAAALADRYRIERELRAGGMATVYLAHDVRHDRKVALNVLRPQLSAILGLLEGRQRPPRSRLGRQTYLSAATTASKNAQSSTGSPPVGFCCAPHTTITTPAAGLM